MALFYLRVVLLSFVCMTGSIFTDIGCNEIMRSFHVSMTNNFLYSIELRSVKLFD